MFSDDSSMFFGFLKMIFNLGFYFRGFRMHLGLYGSGVFGIGARYARWALYCTLVPWPPPLWNKNQACGRFLVVDHKVLPAVINSQICSWEPFEEISLDVSTHTHHYFGGFQMLLGFYGSGVCGIGARRWFLGHPLCGTRTRRVDVGVALAL